MARQELRPPAACTSLLSKSQRWESNPQPPHYECGALPIEATLAFFPLRRLQEPWRLSARNQVSLWRGAKSVKSWSGLDLGPCPQRKKRGSLTSQKRFGGRQWPGASQPQPQITSETPRASRRVELARPSERVFHPLSTQRAKADQCCKMLHDLTQHMAV